VGRHQLLLLADRPEEAEGVHAEAEHADQSQRQQAGGRGQEHREPLAPARRGEHQERQHDPGGQLHADPRHEGRGRGPRTRPGGGCESQRCAQREQHQSVVVVAPHGQHQQYGVQPDECRSRDGGVPEACGGPGDQRDGAEARGRREALEQPQAAGRAERRGEVAGEREQRTVGGVLERPADEREHRIAGGFGGDMGVRIKAVQGAHPREG
jgi:hypothetical protein